MIVTDAGFTVDLANNLSEVDNNNLEISYDTLIEKFYNTHQLCNNDPNKFAFLLRKGVYPYEYMDSWKNLKKNRCLIENIFTVN